MSDEHRVVVGISGASGVLYAVRLLELLANLSDVDVDIVVTQAAQRTLMSKTGLGVEAPSRMAAGEYAKDDIITQIASRSLTPK